MNFLSKKLQVFCISNIMVSLVCTNFVNVTYTKFNKESTDENVSVLKAEDTEPVSQTGNEEEVSVAEEAQENVVTQREVTRSMTYVPARYSEVTGQAVVDYAKRYLGLRYVSGGYSLETGTDCSGFTKLIYSEFGVYLPRSVSGQMYSGSYVRKDDLRKGDLVIYGNGGGYATHVAMYIGDNLVLHQSNPRDGVKISTLYMMQYITARRVINDTAISIVEQQIEEAKKEEENKENEDETTLDTEENNDTTFDESNNLESGSSPTSNSENTENTENTEKTTTDESTQNESGTTEQATDEVKEEPKESGASQSNSSVSTISPKGEEKSANNENKVSKEESNE